MVNTAIRLGIVGFGEGGSLIAQGLAQQGVRGIRAFDPAAGGESGAHLRENASRLGILLADSLAELARGSNVVFSLVTPSAALEVAGGVAAHLKQGGLFADFNSTVPEAKARSSRLIEAAGGSYVDAAVLGSIRAFGHAVPVWAAGSGAERFRESFTPLGMNIRVLAGEAGHAAAVKLLRSVFTKGLEALGIETLLAAETLGLRELVLQALGDLDEKPLAEVIGLMVTSHLVHARRRLHEVEEAIAMIEAGGMDPLVSAGTRDFFARTLELGLTEEAPDGKPLDFEATLALMRRRFVAGGGPGGLRGTGEGSRNG